MILSGLEAILVLWICVVEKQARNECKIERNRNKNDNFIVIILLQNFHCNVLVKTILNFVDFYFKRAIY